MRSHAIITCAVGTLAALLVPAFLVGCDGGSTSSPSTQDDDYGCADGVSPLFANYELLWGDLHGHTVYSADAATQDPPPGPPSEALAYASDPARGNLDFAAITDHGETIDSLEWVGTITECRAAESASFVPFLGFEYTNCSFESGHGHKCVIFEDSDLAPDFPIGADSCATPDELWARLDASVAQGHYMTIPHHPAKGIDYGANMSTDWDAPYADALRQPLVEIYSVHGSSEAADCEEPVKHFQEDKTVDEALKLWLASGDPAYKLGVAGSTDNHRAHPGSVAEVEENLAEREGPYTGGLVAVWAAGLTRGAIWDALQDRRVYATSGGRICLEFAAKAGANSVAMGGTLVSSGPTDIHLHVRAMGEGAAGIERIEIVKNGDLLVAQATDHLDYRDANVSGRAYYRVKVYQSATPVVHADHCPNERAWSSPIWVEVG
jgi:hypothetical protein